MSDKGSIEQSIPEWILTTRNIILIVIGLLTAWNTYISSATNRRLDAEGKKIENLIKQKDFENQLRFKIFEEVKSAISGKDSSLQEVVKVLIEAILVEDTLFQERMKTVLLASRNTATSIKQDIHNSENFRQEQKVLIGNVLDDSKKPLEISETISKPNDNYRTNDAEEKFKIDVFYLEDIEAESKVRAEKIVKLLKRSNPRFEIRLRLLPRSINAQKGYRVDENQIRYDDVEKVLAKEIKGLIESAKVFEKEQPKLYRVTNKTSNYLSVFVRNM